MKKRLISLLLCCLMLVSTFMFGACSDLGGTTVIDPTEEYPEVTIYGIKEAGTTDKAIETVEAALSEISIRKCGVRINLLLFTEEEYAPILFNKVSSEMARYNTDVRKTALSDADKKLQVLKDVDYSGYKDFKAATNISSDVANAKLDIFLVYNPKADSPVLNPESDSYNPVMKDGGMFRILYEQHALHGLTQKFNNGYSALKSSAYPEALKATTYETYESLLNTDVNKTVKEDIYGIPNNFVYGGYEFIMFDDALISQVWNSDRDKAPLVEVGANGGDSDSLIALIDELTACKAAGNIPEDVEIKKVFASYEEFNNYVRDGKKFCIGLINGDISVKELCAQSKQYEVFTRSVNKVTALDLCESMFCISPSTLTYAGGTKMSEERLNKALEVLTLLNTDKDFRNIFQYGVKDNHYTLGRDGIAHITGTAAERYIMNPLYCGNNFIIHPSDRMDEVMIELAKNKWTLGKRQVKDVLDVYNQK